MNARVDPQTVTEDRYESILKSCMPLAADSGAWRYLQSRGIDPRALPACIMRQPHAMGPRVGALVAAVENAEGKVVGAHRVFIDKQGRRVINEYTGESGKRSYGSVKGCVVRLRGSAPYADHEPIICEGVESGLSVWQAIHGEHDVWCTLGVWNLSNVPTPVGPPPHRVVVVADADDPGSEAHDDLLLGINDLQRRKIDVFLATPEGSNGFDANDLLLSEGGEAVRKLVASKLYAGRHNTEVEMIRRRRAQAKGIGPQDLAPVTSERQPEFINITDCKEAALPRRKMLVEDLLERGKLSVLAGQGGTVKSTLAIYLGLSVASGKAAGPFRPTAAYRVGYVGIEDDLDEQRRRMFALLKTPDLKGVRLQDDTLFESGGSFHTLQCDAATLVERHEQSGAILPTDTYRWLRGEIERLKLDLLIVDPLVEITEGVNENDNGHMHKVMALLRVMARQDDIHLMVVHHFNKPGEANNPGAVRGGSAIINAARMSINLEKPGDKDCKEVGIDEIDRHNRIKMVVPKANNSATGAVHWFAIEPKELKNGDRVAAIEHWLPSSEAKPVSDEMVSRFLDALERGRVNAKGEPTGEMFTDRTSGPTGPRADQLLIEVGLTKKAAQGLVHRLKEEGVIGMRPYTNSHREEVEGLVVLQRPTRDADFPF